MQRSKESACSGSSSLEDEAKDIRRACNGLVEFLAGLRNPNPSTLWEPSTLGERLAAALACPVPASPPQTPCRQPQGEAGVPIGRPARQRKISAEPAGPDPAQVPNQAHVRRNRNGSLVVVKFRSAEERCDFFVFWLVGLPLSFLQRLNLLLMRDNVLLCIFLDVL
jgi:hypothetical protein